MGVYTEIEIIVPESAVPGEDVLAQVNITSKYTGSSMRVTCTGKLIVGGVVNGIEIAFGNISYWISYGETASFSEVIVMPEDYVNVYAWSWYLCDEGRRWCQDGDPAVGRIAVAGVEYPASAVLITDFTPTKGNYRAGDSLTYSGTYRYRGKPQNGYLIISIGTGILGTFNTVHTYPKTPIDLVGSMDWATGYINGGVTLPDVLEVGRMYNMKAVIETEDGVSDYEREWNIFTVVADGNGVVPGVARIEGDVVVGLYAGIAVGVPTRIEAVPVSGVTVGNQFQIQVVGTNLADGPVQLGLRYTITKPDGRTVADTLYQIGATAPDSQHSFAEPMLAAIVVDVEGEWLYKVELLGLDHQVGDIREGVLFSEVAKKEIPGIGTIGDMGELIGAMVMMMIMMMMMDIMTSPEGIMATGTKYVEKGKEIAAPVVQIFTGRKKA